MPIPGWIRPTKDDADGNWLDRPESYNVDADPPVTYAYNDTALTNVWTGWIPLRWIDGVQHLCSKVKVWCWAEFPTARQLQVRIGFDGSSSLVVIDTAIFHQQWVEAEFDPKMVAGVEVRMRCDKGSPGSIQHRVYDVQLYEVNGTVPGGANCIGFWKLNDDDTNTIVKDSSPQGKDGVAPRNTDLMQNDDGKINGSFSFDGTESVGVADDPLWDVTGEVSIVHWFRTSVLNQASAGMFAAKKSAPCYGIYSGSDADQHFRKVKFNIRTAYGNIAASADSGIDDYYADGNWHLAVATYDRSQTEKRIKIYIDGQFMGYHPGYDEDILAVTEGLFIGEGRLNEFEGDLDCVLLFNKKLSDAEQAWFWNDGNGREGIGPYHNVYRGQDGNIDYGDVVAAMDLGDSQVSIPNQDLPPDTIWQYIRRQVSECELESSDSPACVVVIGSAGDMIGDTPNPPLNLIIQGLSNGRFKLRWRYTSISEETSPTEFKIYMDSGSGFDFGTPTATVPYGLGGRGEFQWISDPLTNGQLYRFCVRSYRAGPPITESQNTNFVFDVADSVGPAAITGLRASVEIV